MLQFQHYYYKPNSTKYIDKIPEKIATVDDSTHTVATTATGLSGTSSLDALPASNKRVTFGSVSIHSYFIELGGCGVPSCGPSITLGSELKSSIHLQSVECYQHEQNRKGIELYLMRKQRMNMLHALGYTNSEIRDCTIENHRIRKKRKKTVNKLNKAQRRSPLQTKLLTFVTSIEETLKRANRGFPVMLTRKWISVGTNFEIQQQFRTQRKTI